MRIAITGATGLVGSALAKQFQERGDEVLSITRSPRSNDHVGWNPADESIESNKLDRLDCVVHLAGESVAEGRWTKAKKERIYRSRVDATRFLTQTLAKLNNPPTHIISASAIGFYGERGDEIVDESSDAGSGFMAKTCVDWEAAADPAREAGIKVTHTRIGLVMAKEGGALHKMVGIFRWGVGGKVGTGRQYVSWIGIDDITTAFEFVVDQSLEGVVNFVSPNAVTNQELTQILAKALRRPAFLPVPKFGLRIAMGEMGEALLLTSTRVAPTRLESAGFKFQHESLAGLLEYLL